MYSHVYVVLEYHVSYYCSIKQSYPTVIAIINDRTYSKLQLLKGPLDRLKNIFVNPLAIFHEIAIFVNMATFQETSLDM